MELEALCREIRLQEEARRAALAIRREADWPRLVPALRLLRRMDTEAQGRAELRKLLGELLPPGSRILAFQRRFDLTDTDARDMEYMRWIFRRDPGVPLADLPEDTTLQRNLKRRLLDGGGLRTGRGALR